MSSGRGLHKLGGGIAKRNRALYEARVALASVERTQSLLGPEHPHDTRLESCRLGLEWVVRGLLQSSYEAGNE